MPIHQPAAHDINSKSVLKTPPWRHFLWKVSMKSKSSIPMIIFQCLMSALIEHRSMKMKSKIISFVFKLKTKISTRKIVIQRISFVVRTMAINRICNIITMVHRRIHFRVKVLFQSILKPVGLAFNGNSITTIPLIVVLFSMFSRKISFRPIDAADRILKNLNPNQLFRQAQIRIQQFKFASPNIAYRLSLKFSIETITLRNLTIFRILLKSWKMLSRARPSSI